MFTVKYKNNNAYITVPDGIDLPHTLDCGQAFRWEEKENGVWHGVAYGKYLELYKETDGTLVLFNTTERDFESIWRKYFDLDRDYGAVNNKLSKKRDTEKRGGVFLRHKNFKPGAVGNALLLYNIPKQQYKAH